MKMHELEVTIGTDGTVRVHVQGLKGPACEEYVAFFERILSAEAEVERTSEYYTPPGEVETGQTLNLG